MTWARFFDAYEPVHALVAERGGELLGLTHYLFHRSHHGDRADLLSAGSVHQRRRARQGRRPRADQRRLRAGASLPDRPRVYWQTHETNHTAMQLYDKVAEKSGFVVYRKLF